MKKSGIEIFMTIVVWTSDSYKHNLEINHELENHLNGELLILSN